MEMAQLYFARPDEGNALRSIALAVGAPEGDLDPARDTAPNARAYLLRAKILRNQSEFRWARTNLERAAAMGGDHRAEAFMELSQLELSRNDIYAAVRAIDDAVVANRTDERYRRTACETRIQHWDALRRDPALREQGALHCVAYSTQDSTADAEQLFYEGLFHLRGTYPPSRGGDQSRSWARALDAFTRGLERLGDPGRDETRQRIRALLAHGQNNALYCGGFGGATSSVAVPRSEGPMGEIARQEFVRLNIETCSARRS
jgi:hypothetical protein